MLTNRVQSDNQRQRYFQLLNDIFNIDKVDWEQKLSSRKFWAAVAGFVTAVLVAFNVESGTVFSHIHYNTNLEFWQVVFLFSWHKIMHLQKCLTFGVHIILERVSKLE